MHRKWSDVIEAAEGAMALPASRAWLDLQRLVVEACRALGAEYGFRPVFFWQPVIFTKPVLTAFEQSERDRYNYMREFFELAYAEMGSGRQPCEGTIVHDLSAVFAEEKRPMYVDALHLAETGNELVVRAMMPAVGEALGVPERISH